MISGDLRIAAGERASQRGLRNPTVEPSAFDVCAIAVAVVRSLCGNQTTARRVTEPMKKGLRCGRVWGEGKGSCKTASPAGGQSPAAAMRIWPAWYMAKAAPAGGFREGSERAPLARVADARRSQRLQEGSETVPRRFREVSDAQE